MTVGLILLAVGVSLAWPRSSRWRLPKRPVQPHSTRTRELAAVLAGIGVAVGVSGATGALLGLAVAVGSWWVLGRFSAEDRPPTDDLARQAPDAVDCLASCLAAGAPLWPALRVVAGAFGEPLQQVWSRTVDRHDLGSSTEQTFAEWLEHPALAPVGRVLMRSSESGASLTAPLTACAQRMREERAEELEVRARAVGVKAVAPLGVCFLPAFVLLSVVPIVGSMIGGLGLGVDN